jgi:hypothetical protein
MRFRFLLAVLSFVILVRVLSVGQESNDAGQSGADQFGALERTTVLGGKLSLLIPEGFEQMAKLKIAERYRIKGRRPTEVYGNREGTINLALRHSNSEVPADSMKALRRTFDDMLSGPQVNRYSSRLDTIDGRESVIVEMETPSVEGVIFNYMFATSVDGRLLMVTFNCPDEVRSSWESIVHDMIGSVRFTGRDKAD